jgi:ABC-type iron transport system FetAB permease component
MIVGAVSFTGLIAAYLTYRAYFTSAHQLKSVAPPSAAG